MHTDGEHAVESLLADVCNCPKRFPAPQALLLVVRHFQRFSEMVIVFQPCREVDVAHLFTASLSVAPVVVAAAVAAAAIVNDVVDAVIDVVVIMFLKFLRMPCL